MLEVLVLVVALLAGSITAFAIESRKKEYRTDSRVRTINNIIERIDEYWKTGLITDKEKESLLAPYINNTKPNIVTPEIDLTPIKNELISFLDQKIVEINSKIESIKGSEAKKSIKVKREVKREGIPIMPAKDKSTIEKGNPTIEKSNESELEELEEIKKDLLDTLKRLESSEVE